MTIAIVDVLKMIQIELDHRQRPSAALAVAGYRHRLFKQSPAIEQASQGIVPCLPLQRGLQNAHVADHAADHQPGEQQHQGEEDPHQGQGDGDGAKVPADAFPQSVDPQQHAVKIAQFGPADIARQQTQPSLVIMDKRAAQQLLLARGQQGQDIPRRGRSQQVQMAIIKLVLSLLSPPAWR